MRGAITAFFLLSAVAVGQPLPDRPVRSEGQKEIDAMMQAEARYVAKGRATFPAAKKRYLSGLPRGYIFYVRKRLHDQGTGRS